MLKLVCPVPVPRISCYHFHNRSPDTGAQSELRTKLHQAIPLLRQLSDSRHSQFLEPAGNLEQPLLVWWISPGKGAAFSAPAVREGSLAVPLTCRKTWGAFAPHSLTSMKCCASDISCYIGIHGS